MEYRLNSVFGRVSGRFLDGLVDGFKNSQVNPTGFFSQRGISRLNLTIFKKKKLFRKIIVVIFATYFCEKKFATSLRNTGSSWKKMSIPNLSVPLFRQFTFLTSPPEPLNEIWWNLVWMKYSRSLTSVVVFRPDPPREGSRAGRNRSLGSSSSQKFFLRPEGYSNKPNTSPWSRSTWEEVLLFWFHSEVKFLTRFDVFLHLVILVYFNVISIDFYAVKSFI